MRTAAVPSSSGVPASLKGILPVLLALPVLLVLEWLLSASPFATYLLSIIGVNVILAVSLNIVNGMTGQFSIGHAGFMAVGAYIAGVTSLALKDVAHLLPAGGGERPGVPGGGAADGGPRPPPSAASWWACPPCACAGTTWPS